MAAFPFFFFYTDYKIKKRLPKVKGIPPLRAQCHFRIDTHACYFVLKHQQFAPVKVKMQ